MITKRWFWIISCLLILFSVCFICEAKPETQSEQDKNSEGEILEPFSYQAVSEFKETEGQRQARMKWWREARFGLFVHWGPVSLTGKVISWSRGGERRDGSGTGTIPPEIYDNLYKHFNPSLFDAKEWVQIVKDTGMKYIVFVTKHHDGFCMWDTKLTDYKITSPLSPYGRDIAGELADACHEAGIKLIWYFSLGDWYNPDYYTENHDRFTDYMLGQIRELCTNYGKIHGFWFDLGYTKMHEDNVGQRVSNLIHHLQSGAIINNRGGIPGDYDTPEGRIGTFQIDRMWESCMTLGVHWAWKPNDEIKSFEECVYILVNTAGGDGNLLLNVGPMPDGRIEPRQVECLKEVGAWMEKYGQSIYGTRGGPFMPGDYGSSTHKDNRVYLHVLNWDDQSISLPPIGKKVINSFLLTGGKEKVKQTSDEILVTVNKRYQKNPDTIVVLELDGPACEVSPVITAFGSLAFGKKSTASSNEENYSPDNAFDGDDKTSWTAEAGVKQGWLEVDLGKTRTVAQAIIYETYPGRIKEFELQYKAADKWKILYSGIGLGAQAVIRFKPVQAQHVRLNILKATDNPAVLEMKLTRPLATTAKEYKMQGEPVSDEIWATYMDRWVKVGAFNVHQNLRQYGPDKPFEGGRWIADKEDKDGTVWLDVDFGHDHTYNQAVIYTNRYWKRVREFELQQLVNGEWQSFYSDKELSTKTGDVKLSFDPVTIRQLRMKITMIGNNYVIVAHKLELSNTNDTKK